MGSCVAGPLAGRDGGQLCHPFVLGLGNWKGLFRAWFPNTKLA